MTQEDESRRPFERAVVVLDAVSGGIAALEAASAFAEAMARRLDVLFIEEESVHRVAAFPFARELPLRESAARALDATTIARDLRMAAERARAAVETAAKTSWLEWRFEVIRGRIDRTLAEACLSGTLVAVEARQGLAIERMLTAGAGAAAGSLLVVGRRAARRPGPVLLHCDNSGVAASAQALARRIARESRQPLLEIGSLGDFLTALEIPHPQLRPWRPGATAVPRPGIAVVGRTAWPSADHLGLVLGLATCPVLMVGQGTRQ